MLASIDVYGGKELLPFPDNITFPPPAVQFISLEVDAAGDYWLGGGRWDQ